MRVYVCVIVGFNVWAYYYISSLVRSSCITSQGLINGGSNLDKYHADLCQEGETSFLIMKGCETSYQIMSRGQTIFWLRGKTSFLNMKRGRNDFSNYTMSVKRLSEIWFGYKTSFRNMVWCETSFWNMARVQNVFLRYEHGGETSFLSMSLGRNVSLSNGANSDYEAKSLCTFPVFLKYG